MAQLQLPIGCTHELAAGNGDLPLLAETSSAIRGKKKARYVGSMQKCRSISCRRSTYQHTNVLESQHYRSEVGWRLD